MTRPVHSSLALSLACAALWGCGAADEGPATPTNEVGLRLLSATRADGELTLVVESAKALNNIWDPVCGSAPRILKHTAEGWVPLQDDRQLGLSQSYYLDGKFHENCSLGCDGGNSCYEAPRHWELTLSTKEYIQIGTQPPDSADAVCLGRAGPLPTLISQDAEGPLQLEMRYMRTCVSEVLSIHLDIPAN